MNKDILLGYLKQYPLALFCAGVLLLCGLLAVLRGTVVDELLVEEGTLNARIRVMESNSRASNGLDADLGALDAQVEALDALLFVQDERAVNLDFFYSLSDRVGISISGLSQRSADEASFAQGGPNELKLHSVMGYDLTVEGTFQQILAFLYEIKRVDPVMRVSDFQVDVGDARLSARLHVIVLAEKTK